MTPFELEDKLSGLVEQPWGKSGFPFLFLEAFGNNATTIKRLRGNQNKTDIPDALLQPSKIHILATDCGNCLTALTKLRESPGPS